MARTVPIQISPSPCQRYGWHGTCFPNNKFRASSAAVKVTILCRTAHPVPAVLAVIVSICSFSAGPGTDGTGRASRNTSVTLLQARLARDLLSKKPVPCQPCWRQSDDSLSHSTPRRQSSRPFEASTRMARSAPGEMVASPCYRHGWHGTCFPKNHFRASRAAHYAEVNLQKNSYVRMRNQSIMFFNSKTQRPMPMTLMRENVWLEIVVRYVR